MTEIARDCDIGHTGEAAREWLRDHCGALNAKWKHIDFRWLPQTQQRLREESGRLNDYVFPPRFMLTYYRSRFRFFGDGQETVVTFSELDVHSISFRRSAISAWWDAHYDLHIGLSHGGIDVSYAPPFFGATPIASARHSENLRVSYNLHLEPRQT
jgi:hypothetical protein